MKLGTFLLSQGRIFTKLLAFSESLTKTKIRSHRTLSVILPTSADIYKQRLLHGNEIVQHPQN